jgi:spore germination cell wall hydrolase CwlJ-like protein
MKKNIIKTTIFVVLSISFIFFCTYFILQNEYLNEVKIIEIKPEFIVVKPKIIEVIYIEDEEEIIDPPESIYDCFSEEELDFLFRVVQAEIGDEYSFEQKANVACVIFNRLEHDRFPDTLEEILIPSQFSTISSGRYKQVEVSDLTKKAVAYAWEIEDTTGGALFFEGRNSNIHEKYATFLFQDESGHKFYK